MEARRFRVILLAHQAEGNLVVQRELLNLEARGFGVEAQALEPLLEFEDKRKKLLEEAPNLLVLFPTSSGEQYACGRLLDSLRELEGPFPERPGVRILSQLSSWYNPEALLRAHKGLDGVLLYRAPDGLTSLVESLDMGMDPGQLPGFYWRTRPADKAYTPPLPAPSVWPHFPLHALPMPRILGETVAPLLTSLSCEAACPGCPAGHPQETQLPHHSMWADRLGKDLHEGFRQGARVFVMQSPDPMGVDQGRDPEWASLLAARVQRLTPSPAEGATDSGPKLAIKMLSDEVTAERLTVLKQAGVFYVQLRHRWTLPEEATMRIEPRDQVLKRALTLLRDQEVPCELHYLSWQPGPSLDDLMKLTDVLRAFHPLPIRLVWLPLQPFMAPYNPVDGWMGPPSLPFEKLKPGGELLRILGSPGSTLEHAYHGPSQALARLLLSRTLLELSPERAVRMERLTSAREQQLRALMRDASKNWLSTFERQIEAAQWGAVAGDPTGQQLTRELERRLETNRSQSLELYRALFWLESAVLPPGSTLPPTFEPQSIRWTSTGHERCWPDSPMDVPASKSFFLTGGSRAGLAAGALLVAGASLGAGAAMAGAGGVSAGAVVAGAVVAGAVVAGAAVAGANKAGAAAAGADKAGAAAAGADKAGAAKAPSGPEPAAAAAAPVDMTQLRSGGNFRKGDVRAVVAAGSGSGVVKLKGAGAGAGAGAAGAAAAGAKPPGAPRLPGLPQAPAAPGAPATPAAAAAAAAAAALVVGAAAVAGGKAKAAAKAKAKAAGAQAAEEPEEAAEEAEEQAEASEEGAEEAQAQAEAKDAGEEDSGAESPEKAGAKKADAAGAPAAAKAATKADKAKGAGAAAAVAAAAAAAGAAGAAAAAAGAAADNAAEDDEAEEDDGDEAKASPASKTSKQAKAAGADDEADEEAEDEADSEKAADKSKDKAEKKAAEKKAAEKKSAAAAKKEAAAKAAAEKKPATEKEKDEAEKARAAAEKAKAKEKAAEKAKEKAAAHEKAKAEEKKAADKKAKARPEPTPEQKAAAAAKAAEKEKQRQEAAVAAAKEVEKAAKAALEKKKAEAAAKGEALDDKPVVDDPPKVPAIEGPIGEAVQKAMEAVNKVSEAALAAASDKSGDKAKDLIPLAVKAAAVLAEAAAALEEAAPAPGELPPLKLKEEVADKIADKIPDAVKDKSKDKPLAPGAKPGAAGPEKPARPGAPDKPQAGDPPKPGGGKGSPADGGPAGGGGGAAAGGGAPPKPPKAPKGPKPKPLQDAENPKPDSGEDPAPFSPQEPPPLPALNLSAPSIPSIFATLVKLNFMSKFIMVPTKFDPGMLVKFKPGDPKFAIGDLAALAMSLIKCPSPFKIHIDTAVKIGKQYESFIEDVSRGIILSWNLASLTTKFTGILINGPIGMLNPGGMILGPTMKPIIMTVMGVPWGVKPGLDNLLAMAQGFKLAKAICQGISDGFGMWAQAYMNSAIPFPGGAVALGSMIPSPNIPMPIITGNSAAESMVSPAQLKNLMLAAHGPPGNHGEALFDSFAKAFNTMFTLWKATNMIMLVIGAGGVAPAPVPGPVAAAVGNGGMILGMPVL